MASTTREIDDILRNAILKSKTKNEYTLLRTLKFEIGSLMNDVSSIFRDVGSGKKTKSKINGFSDRIWRVTVAILSPFWKHRQYITLGAIAAYGYVFVALTVVALQLLIASSILFDGVWRTVSKIYVKFIIVCMRALRKTLQLPFDIPASLISIGMHGHTPTEQEAQEMLDDARVRFAALSSQLSNSSIITQNNITKVNNNKRKK